MYKSYITLLTIYIVLRHIQKITTASADKLKRFLMIILFFCEPLGSLILHQDVSFLSKMKMAWFEYLSLQKCCVLLSNVCINMSTVHTSCRYQKRFDYHHQLSIGLFSYSHHPITSPDGTQQNARWHTYFIFRYPHIR